MDKLDEMMAENAATKPGSNILDAYANLVKATAVFPGNEQPKSTDGISYCVVALAGEAGELANCWKKYLRIRDTANEVDRAETIRKMMDELGDVLWYVFALAQQFNISMEDVIMWNSNKLMQRKADGTIASTTTRTE